MLSFFLLVVAAYAQTSCPFSVDQDAVSGATDFSFLNEPLSAASRLHVRDGHFYSVGPDTQPNTADDTAVRLYGVNLAFGANFPAPQDAARIAKQPPGLIVVTQRGTKFRHRHQREHQRKDKDRAVERGRRGTRPPH
mgnify:CR=1 FL=1